MGPGSLSELQGHADFPGDVWCQDPGCAYDVEDDVDLLEFQEALQALVDGVESYVDGQVLDPDGGGEESLLSLLLE